GREPLSVLRSGAVGSRHDSILDRSAPCQFGHAIVLRWLLASCQAGSKWPILPPGSTGS
ncbi:unnamed protein product, partial [Symbiodinium pilosum]